eukprot:TRINITY_DN12296_c0_g1_i1.p2 TRINITY_DN12296_c0_g1~~TRINITY_DN12296_c0_g1_i1.p2  ORF type:complete len:110 (-),score=1.78 TRINITY_DN12296_c0_g1_i1:349-678(-)
MIFLIALTTSSVVNEGTRMDLKKYDIPLLPTHTFSKRWRFSVPPSTKRKTSRPASLEYNLLCTESRNVRTWALNSCLLKPLGILSPKASRKDGLSINCKKERSTPPQKL